MNPAVGSNAHLSSHIFCGSGVQTPGNWVLCSGSHEAEIKESGRTMISSEAGILFLAHWMWQISGLAIIGLRSHFLTGCHSQHFKAT